MLLDLMKGSVYCIGNTSRQQIKLPLAYRDVSGSALGSFLRRQSLFVDPVFNDGKFLPGEGTKCWQTAFRVIFCLGV